MFMNILPVAMKVFQKTLSLDIVTTKPMAVPIGKLFYMDFKYGQSQKEIRKSKIDYIFN